MKTVFVTLFLSLCLQADGLAAPAPPAKIRGNWLSYHHYGMSFYRIRRNGEIDCFYRNCINSGTRLRGRYTRSGDTVVLFFPNDTTRLFLHNETLYPFSQPGELFSIRVQGYERTQRSTIWGAQRKVRHELRKRRRQYARYID